MDGAFCAMRNAGVFGYAYWTTQDYAESPLFNPSFGYGLDGWHLITADGSDPERHLIKQPSNDFSLRLAAGDVLRQSIPARRGRLPTTSAEAHLAVKICVTAHAGEAASVEAMAGAAPVQLTISSAVERVCSSIATRAKDSNLELKIRGVSGRVDLTGVQLFDHVQEGGLYGIDGKEGVLLPQLRKLNERFARQPGAADRCQQISPADH